MIFSPSSLSAFPPRRNHESIINQAEHLIIYLYLNTRKGIVNNVNGHVPRLGTMWISRSGIIHFERNNIIR